MADDSSVNRVSLGLLIASAVFFFLNFAIGDTIFGNVIVLFVSLVTGVGSFATSVSAIKGAENKTASLAIMVCAGAIVVSICLMVVTDNISVGYGP